MDSSWRRKATVLVNAIALATCLVAVSGAGARVIPSITTSFTVDEVVPTGGTGATTTVSVPAAGLARHADFNLNLAFSYGATGTTGVELNGSSSNIIQVEDPATYPSGSDDAESVGNLVVDLPPGLVGNPNAIPYEERCDISTFETGVCPDSSVIGDLTLGVTLVQQSQTENPDEWIEPSPGDSYLNYRITSKFTPKLGGTRVALLKTDPEVPAKIGIRVIPPSVASARDTHDLIVVEPDTDSDLRLRSVVSNLTNWLISKSTGEHSGNIRIDYMNLKLFGKLANGNSFMTNPSSCQEWTSTVWANAKYVNDNLAADPLRGGSNAYTAPASSTVQPDCSQVASVPFPASGSVSISTPDRNTSPSFDFAIENPGVQALTDDVSTSPKKIVTTVPASINVDLNQLGRVCQVADFDADNCAASTRVGSVRIETPLISAGLTGDVYLVKQNANFGLPDLGLRVRGAITFTQRGVNRYTGPKFNQIETTFDNIPQVGFSKLTFHLFGGPDGLLRSLPCPSYNKVPAIPNFTYSFTGWTGATASSVTPLNMANCFGIQTLKPYSKCLWNKLPVHPNYQSRARVRNVRLYIDGKLKRSTSTSPFRFDLKLRNLKLKKRSGGRHQLSLKATYDDGTVSIKRTAFKTCRGL